MNSIENMMLGFLTSFLGMISECNDMQEEKLELYKNTVDQAADKYLNGLYKWSLDKEVYELSAYIVEVAKKRGVDIIKIT